MDYENRAIVLRTKRIGEEEAKFGEINRLVPIDSRTLEMIREYRENRKQYSYKGDLLFPITRQRVNQIFRKIAKRAVVNRKNEFSILKIIALTPELLRRSFAMHCIKNGIDINKLAYILGYKLQGDLRDTQYSIAALREEYDRIFENE